MLRQPFVRILTTGAVLAFVAAPAFGQEVVVTGPPPALRANLDAFTKALNAGSDADWEAMALKVFSADFLKSQTAADRKKTLAQLRADFGKISIERVQRQGGPDAPLQIFVKGTVASGIIWVDLDDDSRFESVKPEVRKSSAAAGPRQSIE